MDWLNGKLRVERGIVEQHVDDVKTDGSRKALSVARELLERLKLWKQATQFPAEEDWVFASPVKLGRLPYSYTGVWRELQRAAEATGIGRLGTHLWTPDRLGYGTSWHKKMYDAKYNVVKIGPKQGLNSAEEEARSTSRAAGVIDSSAAEVKTAMQQPPAGSLPQGQSAAIASSATARLGVAVKTWEEGGAEVVEIAPDSPAAAAGLHIGDVINAVDGKRVRTTMELETAPANRVPGSTIRLGYEFRSTAMGWMPKEATVNLGNSK